MPSFLRTLPRLLYPFGSVRRVLRGPARGSRFVVEPGIGLTYALATDDAVPRHFQTRVRPGMTVYDVGANKGQMMIYFARLVGAGGRVVSLEPAPAEFFCLQKNCDLNGLGERVRLLQVAAADRAGTLDFSYDPELPTQGKLLDVERTYVHENGRSFSVESVTLDDLLATEPPPDVIKMDVEGGAAAAFRGARRILDEYHPAIYVELHGPEEQASVRDLLLARGYVAETLDGQRVSDPTAGWFSPLWCYWPEEGQS